MVSPDRMRLGFFLALLATPAAAAATDECGDQPLVPLERVSQALEKSDAVSTEGILYSRSDCPPCPPGVQCEPCERPSLLLLPRVDAPKEKVVLILLDRHRPELRVGQLYRVRVDRHPARGSGASGKPALHSDCVAHVKPPT
jgi:hypothetical protein